MKTSIRELLVKIVNLKKNRVDFLFFNKKLSMKTAF